MVKKVKFDTIEDRNKYIVQAIKASKSASKLSEEVGVTRRQISNICRRYQQNGAVKRRRGSGRPQLLNAREKLRLLRAVEYNPTMALSLLMQRYSILALCKQLEITSRSRASHTKKLSASLTWITIVNKQDGPGLIPTQIMTSPQLCLQMNLLSK